MMKIASDLPEDLQTQSSKEQDHATECLWPYNHERHNAVLRRLSLHLYVKNMRTIIAMTHATVLSFVLQEGLATRSRSDGH